VRGTPIGAKPDVSAGSTLDGFWYRLDPMLTPGLQTSFPYYPHLTISSAPPDLPSATGGIRVKNSHYLMPFQPCSRVSNAAMGIVTTTSKTTFISAPRSEDFESP